MRLLDLDQAARAHHGLITLALSGLSRDAWYRAVRSGSIEQLHPGVARLPGSPLGHRQKIAAAVLAVATDALATPPEAGVSRRPNRVRAGASAAMASHSSASWLWMGGLDECLSIAGESIGCTHDVDVTIADRCASRKLAGVVIHRPTDRGRLTPQRVDGIRCTNILRTLLDVGAVDRDMTHDLLGHALATKAANLDAVESALVEHGRSGRSGVVALRTAVDEWSIDAKPADSVLELAFDKLVRRHDLPPVEFHPTIEGWEVDFRFVGTRVLVECDGWTSHGLDRDQFERDRRRDADLASAGWLVSRHTYRAITTDASGTAQRLRRLLASQPD